MGAKNLTYPDLTSQALRHDDYFIPLDLKLDAEERDRFFEYYKTEFLPTIDFKKALYSPMGNAAGHFPKTVAQTREFLGRIGLTVRNITVFVAPPTYDINDARNIHVDSVKDPAGNDIILEARLSYYEMADTPGVVRWFPKDTDYMFYQENIPGKMESSIWTLPWIQDLKANKVNWEDVPDWEFATVTNAPSGIIRTNIPHHVIQGGGNRLTISAQIVWPSGSPVGVWAHIHNNKHLLGV